MLDVAVAYDRYRFVGNEFLTWLWYTIETDQPFFRSLDSTIVSLDIGNRMVLENHINEASETITITGDQAGLEEGLLSLRKGAVVTEINLILKTDQQEWKFSLKGESLSFSGLKTPEIGPQETRDDGEGMVLQKIDLIEKTLNLINSLFFAYLHQRSTTSWGPTTLAQMKNWVLGGAPSDL